MLSKVWDEITDPFPNFNGCTVEVWEWISNFTPYVKMAVITYKINTTKQSTRCPQRVLFEFPTFNLRAMLRWQQQLQSAGNNQFNGTGHHDIYEYYISMHCIHNVCNNSTGSIHVCVFWTEGCDDTILHLQIYCVMFVIWLKRFHV